MTTLRTQDITPAVSVLCVDDNEQLAQALRVKFARSREFEWKGWISTADHLVEAARLNQPDVVLLDLDMPGRDPLAAAAELAATCPGARVVIFSGHVRLPLIDRAMEAGAWGYAAKSDGEEALLEVMRSVAAGHVAFSPEVRAAYDNV